MSAEENEKHTEDKKYCGHFEEAFSIALAMLFPAIVLLIIAVVMSFCK